MEASWKVLFLAVKGPRKLKRELRRTIPTYAYSIITSSILKRGTIGVRNGAIVSLTVNGVYHDDSIQSQHTISTGTIEEPLYALCKSLHMFYNSSSSSCSRPTLVLDTLMDRMIRVLLVHYPRLKYLLL